MANTRNILTNAFSINMFGGEITPPTIEECSGSWPGLMISVKEISPQDVPADAVSIIGHPDTARIVGGILGREVPANRVTYSVEKGDVIYVAQYTGPRLQEGATELPEGATLKFYRICRMMYACDDVAEFPF